MNDDFIYPDWPAPSNIKSLSTTRIGGFSRPPYNELNLASHVGDDSDTVQQNRRYLIQSAQIPAAPHWLNQVHSTHAINSTEWNKDIEADAIFSSTENHVCTVMTADCLPILLCNRQGDTVAALHAGWRGLAAGIIKQTLNKFSCKPDDIMAWLGPAIGPMKFEVGREVFDTFHSHSSLADQAFEQIDATHYLADIYLLATQYLNELGITEIFGGDFCTVSEKQRFFSYRRDVITGRMASMIWLEPK
ncbi:MAG: peptidoglycan editing factor PgeF [Piscirickettsiaceae bacterium]|nr:peptidoglycan editing factor PgeF [Piscirickettsiaceae bacterium]